MLGYRLRRWPNCNPACTVLAHAGTAKTSVEISGRQTRIDDVICSCTRRLRRRVTILWEHCRIGKHTCAPTDPQSNVYTEPPHILRRYAVQPDRVMGWCRGDNGPSPGNVVGWCFVYYSSFKPHQTLAQCRFKTETLSMWRWPNFTSFDSTTANPIEKNDIYYDFFVHGDGAFSAQFSHKN